MDEEDKHQEAINAILALNKGKGRLTDQDIGNYDIAGEAPGNFDLITTADLLTNKVSRGQFAEEYQTR